jgi:uncharacterized membrane protein
MHKILPFLLLLLLFACGKKAAVEVGGVTVPASLLATADEHSFDYTGNLSKALQKDAKSLQALLLFSQQTDSTASAMHGQVLLAVLEKTGDEFFAGQLATAPNAFKDLWADLAQGAAAAAKNLPSLAPHTSAALLPDTIAKAFNGLLSQQGRDFYFLDCAGSRERYRVVDETGELEKRYKTSLRAPYPGQPAVAGLYALKTGYYGDAALPDNCKAFLVVKKIAQIEAKNFRNTCIPYDYWLLGTEPFWYAQVSAKEGVIEFLEMDAPKTKVFTFAQPTLQDSLSVYSAYNEDSGDNIRIIISKTPCSDGMSDNSFKFRAELTVNGKSYSGCAFDFASRQ